MRPVSFQSVLGILVATLVAANALLPSTTLAQANSDVVAAIETLTDSQVRSYWTSERMQAALPMPLRVMTAPQTGAHEAAGSPGPMVIGNSGREGDIPAEERIAGATEGAGAASPGVEPLFGTFPFSFTRYRLFPDTSSQYQQFPYKATGKLFFTIPGHGDYVCSGSSVNSSNRSVVWTAGHCVFTPGVGFHTKFLFAPARRAGANPLGTWSAKTAFTLNGWTNDLLEYDHGALVMNLGGKGMVKKKIGDAVGFLGFVANASRQQHWHLHGYPAEPRNLGSTPPGAQFDGEHHEICAGTWGTNDLPSGIGSNPATIGVGCDKTGGTSGGPWVIDFSSVAGATNLLNGNNSYRYTGPNPPEHLKLFSPYFTDGAINLRDTAQAVPIP